MEHLSPKKLAWLKLIAREPRPPVDMGLLLRAYQAKAYPFDGVLVRVADLVERFGVTKAEAATFLRANGAVQLPRTTQGRGVPALTLWAMHEQAERLMAKSARARVAIYLDHRDRHPFDPLEL